MLIFTCVFIARTSSNKMAENFFTYDNSKSAKTSIAGNHRLDRQFPVDVSSKNIRIIPRPNIHVPTNGGHSSHGGEERVPLTSASETAILRTRVKSRDKKQKSAASSKKANAKNSTLAHQSDDKQISVKTVQESNVNNTNDRQQVKDTTDRQQVKDSVVDGVVDNAPLLSPVLSSDTWETLASEPLSKTLDASEPDFLLPYTTTASLRAVNVWPDLSGDMLIERIQDLLGVEWRAPLYFEYPDTRIPMYPGSGEEHNDRCSPGHYDVTKLSIMMSQPRYSDITNPSGEMYTTDEGEELVAITPPLPLHYASTESAGVEKTGLASDELNRVYRQCVELYRMPGVVMAPSHVGCVVLKQTMYR